MKALVEGLRRYWTIIRRPSTHFSLGFLVIGSFIAGIVFWRFMLAEGEIVTPRAEMVPLAEVAKRA